MTDYLAHIVGWLVAYRYFVLFPIAVVEGPIISIIAGFLCSQGYLDFFPTYLLLVCADLAGDTVYYLIGYYGRKKFFNRFGRYVGVTPERLAALEGKFTAHGGKTLLAGKVTQVAGGGILVAAGAAHMPYWRFMGFNLAATFPKSLILIVIGYYFGQAYVQINRYFNYASLGVGVVIALAMAVYLVVVRKRTRSLAN